MLMTQPIARPSASPAAIWTALVTVYVVWGSTYLAIRVVVESAPPLLSMGARFLTAGLLLAGILAWRSGPSVLRVTRRGLASAGLVGLLLLLCGNGFVALAEQTVPSGLAALLVAATPLWLVLLRAGTGDRPRAVTLAGTLIGFGGVALLALPGGHDGDVEVWGIGLIAFATFCWAVGSFFSSRLPMPANPFVATVWEMLLGGFFLVIAGSVRGELGGLDVGAVETEAWFALAYLVVFGSLLAFSAYVWLLANAEISLTATYAYVNPIVAVVLGALILDEAVTAAIVGGGLIVVVGVSLVVSTERPRRATPPEPVEAPTEPGAPQPAARAR
jgi:drug/metabolite transporter (DMT)-like permease